jgi:hypothetical protein
MDEPPCPETADFGAAWAGLEPQLRRSLRSAPAHVVDDVLQETSIKLLRIWDTIDRDRPALPLAITIARNTLRDEMRRSARHSYVELSEDTPVQDDIETLVSARLQLARVGEELTRLTPGQRAALLTEVGGGSKTPDSPKVKMLRSRARARLRELVAQAGGFVTTGLVRLRSTAAGRAFAGAPDFGMLAQALLLAVVAAGSAAVVADLPPAPAERASVQAAAGKAGSMPVAKARAPKAATAATRQPAPAPSTQAGAPGGVVPGGGSPSNPGLPTPPLPRSQGEYSEGGYFGTEGFDQAGSGGSTTAGHEVAYGWEAEWESPGCLQRLSEGQSPGTCEAPGAPSATVEVEVDGRRHRVSTEDRRRP